MELDFGELCKGSFEKGTNIGFDKEEIKKTSTEDLLTLRKSIVIYLKSKKLKKRNANFMEVYQRINDELKNRKLKQQEGKEDIEGLLKVEIAPKRKASTADLASTSLEETYADKPLLSRKTSMAFEVEIPSFFNDKKQKCEPLPAPVKNDLKKEEDKPCSCLKNCIKSFGKGLFDEKLDFEPSSDMETFRVVKKQNFDDELKEIEIKSAMFNAVPEDMFFSLD